jgi:hypothetical protein
MKIGIQTETNRGFPIIEFVDRYGVQCSLQASSLADNDQPGTSAVWIGPDEPNPQILASDAAKHGIATCETSGWIPYPLPPNVVTTTRAHLDRKQVQGLIDALRCWLDTGNFDTEKHA